MTSEMMDKSKALSEGTTGGFVVESPGETAVVCPLPFGPDELVNVGHEPGGLPPFGPDEPVNVGHEPEGLPPATGTNVSVTLDQHDFLTSLVERLAAFNDWLHGPPLSNQDRVNAQIIRARNDLYWTG